MPESQAGVCIPIKRTMLMPDSEKARSSMGGMGTATSSTINIGTLVVDLYDAASRKLVWRGDATKTLNASKDPQKNQKNLEKAIAKLLKNYPPPVKK